MFVFIVVYELLLYGMVVNFCGDQVFRILLGFLSMISEVLYTWCLRYNQILLTLGIIFAAPGF